MHTPGPWEIDGDILLTRADPFETIPFGRVNINHAFDEEERQANRDLIEAAPDLLEALENVLRLQECNAYTHDEHDAVQASALSAIAKAKGVKS